MQINIQLTYAGVKGQSERVWRVTNILFHPRLQVILNGVDFFFTPSNLNGQKARLKLFLPCIDKLIIGN